MLRGGVGVSDFKSAPKVRTKCLLVMVSRSKEGFGVADKNDKKSENG